VVLSDRKHDARQGGLGRKTKTELSCMSWLGFGLPCEMVVGDSGEGWCGGVGVVMMVVRPSGCKREVKGRKPLWVVSCVEAGRVG
jgi:hypothetical protein